MCVWGGSCALTGLRFFGYLEREKRVAPTIRSLASPSLGEWAQHFCDFLRDRGCQYSTCANYLSCLINMTQWAWDTMPVEEAALALTPQPPEQLLRLRAQCEAHARQDRLWQRKSAGWIDFEDAQKARVKAIDACEKRPSIKLLREVSLSASAFRSASISESGSCDAAGGDPALSDVSTTGPYGPQPPQHTASVEGVSVKCAPAPTLRGGHRASPTVRCHAEAHERRLRIGPY